MKKRNPSDEKKRISQEKDQIIIEIRKSKDTKRRTINKTRFNQLKRVAINYAYWMDYQLREDFAQEYCIAVWEGKTDSLEYQFANFCRKYYGRNDKYAHEKQKAKSLAMQGIVSYEEEIHVSTVHETSTEHESDENGRGIE